MAHQFFGYPGVAAGGGSIYSAPNSSGASVGDASSFAYDFERIAARYAGSFGYGNSNVGGSSDQLFAGIRRSAEALYHQSILGGHSTLGQPEDFYSANMKRPRIESNLPVYPQRPGEKDCAFYMATRTCKFGDTCKYDHPIWVPEGGIPDWKEIPAPATATDKSPPERPGEPDCPYYLKTSKCKYGNRCKFNHPKKTKESERGGEEAEESNTSILPERPTEPICSYYSKTGKCRFGATCKFHHPKDIQVPSIEKDSDNVKKKATTGKPASALSHNSKGLPIRVGEADCPFYMKTGSCKYGALCRYSHPDLFAINPMIASTDALSTGVLGISNPAASLLGNIDLQQSLVPLFHPQRPGAPLCDFYMKTGHCKFGQKCRFHHPPDRANPELPENVTLTLAGLPRREGAQICAFYMKTAMCKFGASCKFDHPPPEEAVSKLASQGTATAPADEGEEGEN